MISKLDFFGISIHLFTKATLTQTVIDIIDSDEDAAIIPNHNLHSAYLFHKYEKMREFYSLAKYVHVDGMSLVLIGKLSKKNISQNNRITYIDWMESLLPELNRKGKKIFYLGSKPGVAAKAAATLKERFTSLQIEVADGYFDVNGKDNQSIIEKINAFEPDVLMVGMGMPRQEYWVMENYKEINASVILTSGACFDYIAGEVNTPPRIWGKIGLEWLYRLLTEPKRLWKRYLLEPIFLLLLLLKRRFMN